MSEREYGPEAEEASRVVASFLHELSQEANAGAGEGPRLFFPNGIELIQVTAKIGAVEVEFRVSGPNPGLTSSEPLSASPAGETLSLKATGFVQLPQGSADYRTYSAAIRQYGTQKTIDAILRVGAAVHGADPNLWFSVGDISFSDGSTMPPHSAHKMGRNVDIRPICKDRVDRPTKYTNSDYDQVATQEVVDGFLADANVSFIIFNDPGITGVNRDPSGVTTHDNHLHVQTKA